MTFGTTTRPVRNHPDHPIHVNNPDGFMTDPPGELWWIGMHDWWEPLLPASVSRATAIIVNPLVRMPWLVTDSTGRTYAPHDPGYPWWVYDPMLINGSTGGPNTGAFHMLERLDPFDLWSRWIRDALQHGLGLLRCRQQSDGQPLAGTLQRVSPFDLQPGSTPGEWRYQDYGVDVDATYTDGIYRWRLIPLRHSIPGGVFGRHRAQLQLAARVTEYGNQSLNSGVPSGVLATEQPINQVQADATRDEWERTQTRRRIAVLGNGARYQQVVMSPVEAELVAMAELSNQQVAHMFELAAWHLDAPTGGSTTYANARDNRQELVDGTLASWSARIEATLGSLLPTGWHLRIDFTHYTTPTTPTMEGARRDDAATDPA